MSIGKLYGPTGGPPCLRIRAIAALGGLEIDAVTDGSYTFPDDNNTPEFLAKFPQGKVPAFESGDFRLSESLAITNYVASLAPNSGLLGLTPKEAALVQQWTAFSATEVEANFRVVGAFLGGKLQYVKPVEQVFREKLLSALQYADSHLKTRTYLVGHRITVADVTLASWLHCKIFKGILGAKERATIPNVVRLTRTIAGQKKIAPIFGPEEYVEQATQYTPPAKEKKPAPAAAAAAPAAPKPKAAPKPAADDDDDEPLVAEEPKAKNPLDSLPKSTFNLEDWKRAYSNLDTRGAGGSLEWFYKNFDAEGFSLWKVAFKYPEELTMTFMSSNQIGGFFNRLEGSRKYLFGSMGVLGTNNNSLLYGALVARGPDIKPVIEVAPDWESYEYTKIDLSKPEDKAYFEAALAWDLEINGKKWADGKNFK